MAITQQVVDDALRVAVEENGYNMNEMSSSAICYDLLDYYPWPDNELPEYDDIFPLVENWKSRQ